MRAAELAAAPRVTGTVRRVVGLALEVDGLHVAIGDAVEIQTPGAPLVAEVVALRDDRLVCMPLGPLHGVRAGTSVQAHGGALRIPVGPALLGRVLDGLGRPLDNGPSLTGQPHVP
ncbi:MAG: EscN/YscN/HrcN family type III secretion system ATPase, partial [Frankiales bacterium]|nr:EscN/YscN/HrcN family type III secretion system ATPase [Frankiales bacterium]